MQLFSKSKKNVFLFEELVKRDFIKKYKRTVLGAAWSIISPLLTLLVMKLVFTNFFGRSTPHYTTYLFCGNLLFTFFREATNDGMKALVGNASIITKINVPKHMFVLSKITQSFINFCLNMVVFFVFCIFDNIQFSWSFLTLLYPTLMCLLFCIGLGMILSASFVFFTDIRYLWAVFTRLLMYMSAIFYRVDTYPVEAQQAFLFNPIYCFIKYYRSVVIDGVIPTLSFHLLCFGYTAVALLLGIWVYKKNDDRFLYYL